jgi:hypothetical protein
VFAANVLLVIESLRASGVTNLRSLAGGTQHAAFTPPEAAGVFS